MKKYIKIILSIMGAFLIIFDLNRFNAINTKEYNDEINAINQQEDSFLKTLKINMRDMSIVEKSDIDFSNKKITCIGDSITYGCGGSDNGIGGKISYCDFLANILNCEVVNLGIGGAAIGDYWDENSLILRWNQIPLDSDIIIFFAGTNDFFIGQDYFGDVNKRAEKTFCGDTYTTLLNIKNNYPNADIYVLTIFQNGSEYWESFRNGSLPSYMDVLKLYSDELDLNLIDLYSSGFLNSKIPEIKETFVPDEIHPNDAGNKILAYRIASEIILNEESKAANQETDENNN